MSSFSMPSREESPMNTVRTIARVAQMLIELRDEYVERHRDETLAQIDQRLKDLADLRAELQVRIEHQRQEN